MLSLLGLTFFPSAFEIYQSLEKFQNPYKAYAVKNALNKKSDTPLKKQLCKKENPFPQCLGLFIIFQNKMVSRQGVKYLRSKFLFIKSMVSTE